jgi:hypothetical protein
LAKKVVNNNIMWMFENIFANLTWCILLSLMQRMLQISNALWQ